MSAKADDKRDAKRDKGAKPPVTGSGPGGRIELSDIHSKLDELKDGVDGTTAKAKPYLTYGIAGGALLILILSFVVGKRAGRRKTTWIEIRRQ